MPKTTNLYPSALFAGAALASLAPSWAAARDKTDNKQAPRPNIVFIFADDMGYGDLGCYGQEKIETPNLDELARRGMRFTQHYAGCALSSPSRCVLFTGMHTGHSYIRGNDELGDRGDVGSHESMYYDAGLEGQRPMPAGTVTFPKQLQKAGYTTGCVGKWGLGYPDSEGAPNKMGFDFFYGYNCQRLAHDYYPAFLYRNQTREYLPNRIFEPGISGLCPGADPLNECSYEKFNAGVYAPDLMLREVLSFVENSKDDPFLLMWTTTIPHMGLQAPKKWVDYYHEKFGDEEPFPGGKRGYWPSRYPRATFAAMISTLDEHVGILIARLKELGIYDNTLIVFSSDNGSANKGGPDPVWFNSGGPFRSDKGWGKNTLHEGGIRVPMIAAWEGRIEVGSTSDLICASWDFFPTFCELAGAEATPTDGISLVPELTGTGKQPVHEFLYWELPGTGFRAVRMGKWKGLLRDWDEGNKHIELYDLENDMRETADVSAKYPKVIKDIREKMLSSHTEPEVALFRLPNEL